MKMNIMVPTRRPDKPVDVENVLYGLLLGMYIDMEKAYDTCKEVEKTGAEPLCWVVPAITFLGLPVRFTHNPEVKSLCLEVEVK